MNFKKAMEAKEADGAASPSMSIGALLGTGDDEQEINESYLVVPHSEVYSEPQVREEFDLEYIEELAASMSVHKQQAPIHVDPRNAQGYRIQKGECRWRAIPLAGLDTVKILVCEPEATQAGRIAGQLVENIQRDNLKPLEIAKSLAEMRDVHGLSPTEISGQLGKPKGWVSKHLSLIDLPIDVKALYDSKAVRDVEMLNALKQLFLVDEECGLSIIDAVRTGDLSRKAVQELVRDVKAAKKHGGTTVSDASAGGGFKKPEEDEIIQSVEALIPIHGAKVSAAMVWENLYPGQSKDVINSREWVWFCDIVARNLPPVEHGESPLDPTAAEQPSSDENQHSPEKQDGQAEVETSHVDSTLKPEPEKEQPPEIQTTFIEPISINVEVQGMLGTLVLNAVSNTPGNVLVRLNEAGDHADVPAADVKVLGAEQNV